MHLSHYRFLLALAVVAAPLAVRAAPHYAYTAVGLTTDKSMAVSISNSGNIAGNMYYTFRGFLYSQKGLEVIEPLPGGGASSVNGVNNSGQVVGESGGRAFVYSNGTMTDLGLLDSASPYAAAYAINDAGDIAGMSSKDGYIRAFVYRHGVMQSLGTLGGLPASYAYAINNRGQVAGGAPPPAGGMHAVLFENGVVTDLGTLGGTYGMAVGINDRGHVAGWSDTIQGYTHPFLYVNGVMRDLGSPVPGKNAWTSGINNLDQVVGTYDVGLGRAFIYDERGGMRDLTAMVDPASGWFIHNAYSINDRQQIVGIGCKNGEYGAVLLVPTQGDGTPATASGSAAPAPQTASAQPENPPCRYGYP